VEPRGQPETAQARPAQGAPPARAAPPREAAAPRLHEVVADDTLQSLAERYYGDRSRWIDLFQANRDTLRAPGDLKAGSKIRIP
jgi:nucleoid-associated protein YgaU